MELIDAPNYAIWERKLNKYYSCDRVGTIGVWKSPVWMATRWSQAVWQDPIHINLTMPVDMVLQ